MPELKLNPKFHLSRVDSTVVLAMNSVMATSLLEILDDFEQLNEHEYALREQLRPLARDATANENGRARIGQGRAGEPRTRY
jgi:hypothetical protein